MRKIYETKKLLSFLNACVMTLSLLPSNIVFAGVQATGYSKNAQQIDVQYAYVGDDLGATYSHGLTTFKVWAPTATSVSINFYTTGTNSEEGARSLGNYSLVKATDSSNKETGVWTITVISDLKNMYYTYSIRQSGVTKEVRDIYSKAVGADGNRSMVVDLNSTDPAGWDEDSHVFKDKLTDSIIYKIGIKDFTSQADSGISESNRGSYLAFTETGTTYKGEGTVSTGIDYLKQLGITTVQLDLFACDDIYDKDAGYTSNPYDGNVRIKEQKQMIQALHAAGLSVVTELPFAYDNGVGGVFENTVKGYYLRRDESGNFTCDSEITKNDDTEYGNIFASERAMYRNYILQMLSYYVNEYHIDGFCFNRSGNLDTETFNMAREELDKINPKIALYGDGARDGGTYPATTCTGETLYLANNSNRSKLNERVAIYDNYFSESFSKMLSKNGGFVDEFTDNLNKRTPLKSIRFYPTQGHLCDKIAEALNLTQNDERNEDTVKLSKMALALGGTFPGAVMINAGDEVCGANTKYFNWDNIVNYADLLSYYRGIVQIKKAFSPLSSADDNLMSSSTSCTYITDGDTKKGYILKNSTANEWENLLVLPNVSETKMTVTIPEDIGVTDWVIVANNTTAGVENLGEISGREITVSPQTTLIAVDKESFNTADIKSKVDFGRVKVSYVSTGDGSSIGTGFVLQGKIGTGYKVSVDIGMPQGYDVEKIEGSLAGVYGSDCANIIVKLREKKIEKNITLGSSALSGYDSTNGYDYIYYGTYNNSPVKWRVLDMAYNYGENDSSKTSMLVLSENALAKTQFGKGEVCAGGTMMDWCNDMYNSSFGTGDGTKEKDFILETILTDNHWRAISGGGGSLCSNEYLFFLSYDEAMKNVYFPSSSERIAYFNGNAALWWLRSEGDGSSISSVKEDGGIVLIGYLSNGNFTVRPAFNLNSSKILFTSAAKGGKKTGEYKLTMLDESRNFVVDEISKNPTVTKGGTFGFGFSKAKTGENEYISVMLVKDDAVAYYGHASVGQSGEFASFTVPDDIALGTYELRLFNEQINGDYKTDYSSAFETITLSVEKPKATFTAEPSAIAYTLCYSGSPHNLVNAGASNDGTVMYSLSENGTYSDTVPTGKNAGDYTVWYYIKGDNAHSDSAKDSIDVTIVPLPVEIKWDENDAFTYDGNEKEYTATITNIEPGDTVNITYSGNKETNVCTLSPYIAKITAIDNSNYTLMGPHVETEHDWWINPKIVTATISNFDINNPTYTGIEIKPNFIVFDGTTVIPEDEYMIEYSNNINAGTATIKLTDKEYGNYTVSGSTTFTIKPLPVEIKWKNTEGLVYDGTPKTVTAEVLNKYRTDEVNLSFGGDSLTQTDKGTYTATVTAVDNENYTIEDGQNLTKEWSIAQAADNEITGLAISGWTYGETANSPTASAKY